MSRKRVLVVVSTALLLTLALARIGLAPEASALVGFALVAGLLLTGERPTPAAADQSADATGESLREVAHFVDTIRIAESTGEQLEGRRLELEASGDAGRLVSSVNEMARAVEARERAMRRDMFQRRAILASMADGVLAVDGDQRVVLVNETAHELLRFATDAPEGELLGGVVHQEAVLGVVRDCLIRHERCKRRAVLKDEASGQKRILMLRASPLLRAPDGGCVLVIEDRTELERLERVRRDFVANVSHELKTPLTSVRGYIETVRDDPDLPPDVRDRFLEKSIRNADRLGAIIGDLLTLARAEGDGEPTKSDPIDLARLAAEVSVETTALAAAKGIELVVDAPDSLVMRGDRGALASALVNLVENAIKYSPAQTRVRIEVSHQRGRITLAVEDQGPGIPEQHLTRIFERFYRIDKDRSRELGGTGLGLSIVRHVALAHGGQARVQSTVGEGSRFWIELPATGLLA